MINILMILAISALVSAIVALAGKCPIGVPVLLLAIIAALQVLPLGVR